MHPTNLQSGYGEFVSNAATANFRALVASPGAGRRIRVWSFGWAPQQHTMGDVWSARLQNAAGTLVYAKLAGRGPLGGHMHFPGGLAMAENAAAGVMESHSAAAAQNVCVWVVYTVEAV